MLVEHEREKHSHSKIWFRCPCSIPRVVIRAPRNPHSVFLPLLTSAPATHSAVALSRGTRVPQPMARTPLLSRSPPASTGWRTPDILELVVLGDKKRSSFTSSMQRAVETSPLLHPIAHVVPAPRNAPKDAIFTSRFPDVLTYHDARFLAVAFDADPAIQQSPYCKV